MNTLNIKEILEKQADDLLEEILRCMSDLNLLTTFTLDELDMTQEQVNASVEEQKSLADELVTMKNKIDHWRDILEKEEGSEEEYRQQILEDCPWLKIKER